MAATISATEFFQNGNSGVSAYVGHDSYPRVARCAFTVDGEGAGSLAISLTVYGDSVSTEAYPSLRAAVSTSATEYANAVGTSHGIALSRSASSYTGTITGSFEAGKTYYLFFFPDSTSVAYKRYSSAAIATSGAAETGLECYVYTSGAWKKAAPYVYSGGWKEASADTL